MKLIVIALAFAVLAAPASAQTARHQEARLHELRAATELAKLGGQECHKP